MVSCCWCCWIVPTSTAQPMLKAMQVGGVSDGQHLRAKAMLHCRWRNEPARPCPTCAIVRHVAGSCEIPQVGQDGLVVTSKWILSDGLHTRCIARAHPPLAHIPTVKARQPAARSEQAP